MNTRAPQIDSREMRFVWRGVDAAGAQRSGTLIAPDTDAARTILKRDNLFVVALVARGPAASTASACRGGHALYPSVSQSAARRTTARAFA